MKRVVIVHGWGQTPNDAWYPWMKKELEERGFAVVVPELPITKDPRKELWVPALAEAIGTPDAETYFIGHSLGCPTIARYLETLPLGTLVGGVVYVAGFFRRLTNMNDPQEQEVITAWLSTTPDFAKIRSVAPRSIAIFSDNDEWVPLDNSTDFRDQLGSRIVIVKDGDHFNGGKGWFELPVARDALAELAER